MASKRKTLAFAGSGATTVENAKALLNDFLGLGPDDAEGFPALPENFDLHILFPVSETHTSDGLGSVFDWTEYADLDYSVVLDRALSKPSREHRDYLDHATAVEEVANVNKAIIDALAEEQASGREVHLVLLWGEEGDDNSEILLDLAAAHDIKALDLTAGLDDIGFEEEGSAPEPEVAPEPEPEPEPEKPSRRGSRRKDEPLEDVEQPLEDEPQETKPEPKKGKDVSLEEVVARAAAEKTAKPEDSSKPGYHVVLTEPEFSADLLNRFTFHPADANRVKAHDAVRKVMLEVAQFVTDLVPAGREQSLAITKIEEAMFWANAALARAEAPSSPVQPEPGVVAPAAEEKPAERPSGGRGRPRKDGSPAKPRSAEEKAVMEIWDEDIEEWVRKGRGRAPKGAKTRMVDPVSGDVVSA